MAPKHDEVNVFKIPHGRMMQLVNSCNEKLTVTDFANNDALLILLSNLDSVFHEFKSHEEIENKYIMTKLKSKLKALAIHNSAVCNCHKNDEFTPLFGLVEKGYLHINKTISNSERISFGIKLRKALNQFTKRFVPHMKEEEEEFQPLLMKYFNQDELVEMKNIVIKSHMQQRKSTVKSEVLCSKKIERSPKEIDSSSEVCFNELPNEIILNIFSYLTYPEKFKAARVSKKWNNLIYDKSNWKKVSFLEWKSNIETNSHKDKYESSKPDVILNKKMTAFKDIDFIDESDEEFENEFEIQQIDLKIIHFWIKNLLPKIGNHLKELNLNSCKSLNNNLARRILQLCPNINILNMGFSNIEDNAFRGVRLDKLTHLNLEGCNNITDTTFKHLFVSNYNSLKDNQDSTTKDSNYYCNQCRKKMSIEEFYVKNDNKNEGSNTNQLENKNCKVNFEKLIEENHNFDGLEFLNLSGCWQLTDSSLGFIVSKYNVKNLNYLNLSGCINFSSFGLCLFVEMCSFLTGENLYYCDNVDDGPMKDTANGCENLECNKKFCCRSGQ